MFDEFYYTLRVSIDGMCYRWAKIASLCAMSVIGKHFAESELGVGRVQIIRVDYSRTKNRLDIEHSQSLVSTITGTNIQYGGSRKQ